MVETTYNFIESVQNPTLVRGGPSSSKTLNDIHGREKRDLVRLDATVSRVARELQLTNAYLNMAGPSLQALSNHIAALIPAAPANRGRQDFFITTNLSGSFSQDVLYGQAYLPILSTEDKIVYTDTSSQKWVPEDSRIRFYTSSAYGGIIPGDDEFLSNAEDYKGLTDGISDYMLGSYLAAEGYVYLKLLFPQGLNTSTLTNRLQCTILPMFKHSLVGSHIRRNDGQWVTLPIDYLPGYASLEAPLVGPTQLHFSPTEIRQACLVFKVQGWWGVKSFSAQLVEYAATGNITADFASYSPTTITNTSLYGMDTIGLSRLAPTVSGTSISVPLTQAASYTSPILTGIEARW